MSQEAFLMHFLSIREEEASMGKPVFILVVTPRDTSVNVCFPRRRQT